MVVSHSRRAHIVPSLSGRSNAAQERYTARKRRFVRIDLFSERGSQRLIE
jgi:hypothetical protein